VIKLLSKEMKKERSRTCQAITAMIALNFLTFLDNVLTVGGRLGVKSKLAGLRLIQEASQKELEVVQRRTSTRLSGGSKSFAKNTSAWLGPRLKKNKNKHASICNCFIFIEIFRELSNTLYTY
jgi:hypothetical protein